MARAALLLVAGLLGCGADPRLVGQPAMVQRASAPLANLSPRIFPGNMVWNNHELILVADRSPSSIHGHVVLRRYSWTAHTDG